MKRDLDLVRAILLEIEEAGGPPIQLSDVRAKWGQDAVNEHVRLLIGAGIIEGLVSKKTGRGIPQARPFRITWEGHDWLDAAREPTRWEKAKATASKAGGAVTFEVMKQILVQLAEKQVGLT